MTLRQIPSDSSVAEIAERLIGWEAEESRVKKSVARAIVAREARIAPGSLERLAAGRLKYTERIGERLNALLIGKKPEKIASLERELERARLRYNAVKTTDLIRAADCVEEAERILAKAKLQPVKITAAGL
jgi:hypothetical protein